MKKLKTTEQAWCYGSKLDQGHVGAAVCWSLGEIKQLVSGIDTELRAISEGLGQCK